MAADAVLKIKQAEDKAGEIIRAANRDAKGIVDAALKKGTEKRDLIIARANEERSEILAKSREKAEAQCIALMTEAGAEIDRLKNPDPDKFDRAIRLVIERIVN